MPKKGYKQTEDHKNKIGESSKEVWKRPGMKEKISRIHKERWEKPGYKEKLIEIHKIAQNRPEVKKKRSYSCSGEKNGNWDVGNSNYWAKEMKKTYKDCYLCKSPENLEMHHRDGNHNNNDRFNRVIICHKCHTFWHKTWYKIRGQLNVINSNLPRFNVISCSNR